MLLSRRRRSSRPSRDRPDRPKRWLLNNSRKLQLSPLAPIPPPPHHHPYHTTTFSPQLRSVLLKLSVFKYMLGMTAHAHRYPGRREVAPRRMRTVRTSWTSPKQKMLPLISISPSSKARLASQNILYARPPSRTYILCLCSSYVDTLFHRVISNDGRELFPCRVMLSEATPYSYTF